jgi:hypothetical protein
MYRADTTEQVEMPKTASSLFTWTSVVRLPRCAVRDVRPFPMFGVGVVNRDAIIDIPKVAIDGTCALAPKLTCDKKNLNPISISIC